jgi:hypothetical protein
MTPKGQGAMSVNTGEVEMNGTHAGSRLSHRALLALIALLVCVAGCLLASASALAAAPEAPEVSVESVTAFAVTFHGVLNPKEAAEPNNLGGTYRFLYREASAKAGCAGGKVMKPSSLYFGGVHEEVSKPVSGLAADTGYVVCLSVTNLEGETAQSAPVAFTTAIPPEKPDTTEPVVDITATSVVLEGTLNPHGSATTKAGWYFAYDEGSSCTGAGEQRTAQEAEVEGKALPEKTEVTNLEPDRTYRVCLVATDERGEPTPGNEVLVKTLAPAPVVVAGAASYSNAAPFEATLHAEADANNQETTVYFQYSTSSVVNGNGSLSAGPIQVSPGAPGSSIGAGVGNVSVEAATGPVLTAGTLYYYQAVAINPTDATYGAVERFETLGVPTVQTGAAEGVTAASASLGGKLDAGGEAEYYIEYGTAACAGSSCGTKSPVTHVSGKVQECTLGGVLQQCVTPILVNGLEPNTTYHYWLVADNGAAGKPVHGAPGEFTTKVAAPSPQTGLAEDVTATSAQIPGTLNPGGGQTEYWVEYISPQGTIGQSARAFVSGKAQASLAPITIEGLQPNTTYYYWLAARNSAVGEPVHGQAHAFTTSIGRAELEAQAAAGRKPAEEAAAANAAKQKLEEEARRAEETAASANAAKQKQYDEIAVETAGLAREEAQAGEHNAKVEKTKPKRASCRKGAVRMKNKCVSKKSEKKGKVKK